MKRVLVVGIPIVCVIGIAIYFFASRGKTPSPNDAQALAHLRWVEGAQPDRDVQAAIEHSDFKFLSVGGYAVYEPGINRTSDQTFVRPFGTRFLNGTSDYLLSKEHARLNSMAVSYAERYNMLLLEHLKSKKGAPDPNKRHLPRK